MSDPQADSSAGRQIPVSPNNPCPFLRALVACGYVGGHIVPLPKLTSTIEAATGDKGLKARIDGIVLYVVALIANGMSPLRWLKSWRSGAVLDELRNGPLDKRGVGSRILSVDGEVDESEIERLASFGSDYAVIGGGAERGLNSKQIKTYMDANFARAKGRRRWVDRQLMKAEWPVLLDVMGKGEGVDRYLSVSEVRTLFVDRRFPERIVARLTPALPMRSRAVTIVKAVASLLAVLVVALVLLVLAITQFPDQLRSIVAAMPGRLSILSEMMLPPPLPDPPPIMAARWLDQNWSTEDRYWFHHVSQGTKTFPVPYAWFVALEQPRIYLFSRPGLLSDSNYLERFGFIPSPKTIHTDKATLLRYGYGDSADPSAPVESPTGKWQVENSDGLPVGFARLIGSADPGTGAAEPDMIGLTCAACHSGSIHYKGTSIRYDGGPAMVNLLKLEQVTGLSITYTLLVPGRFDRFATRVLGPDATEAQRTELKKGLCDAAALVKTQAATLENLYDRVHRRDTEEGYGRLDALNRIGNQVFYTNPVAGGLTVSEENMHLRDAPVSFPPIWTAPWFYWAQYDASIEQPLIRNAGEALGVSASINLSRDKSAQFRSSIDVANIDHIEKMLGGPNPFEQKRFAGLTSPKWPSEMFPGDSAWQIKLPRVDRGRTIYAEICAECHLGPINDPAFDAQFPDKSFWSPDQSHWQKAGDEPVLDLVLKSVDAMGTDPGQANVLKSRTVQVPAFLDVDPARYLGEHWGCPDLPAASSSGRISFALALMTIVDQASRKWMDDNHLSDEQRQDLWRSRKNCPNPANAKETHYRARPLDGVWATAPYLHNGSVPSLYWMLRPEADRPKQFCMGTRDFDPQQVGFRVGEGEKPTCRRGETLFSVIDSKGLPIPGNSNLGHSLEGTPGPGKPGVIGRLLKEDERYDLIEYLKTL